MSETREVKQMVECSLEGEAVELFDCRCCEHFEGHNAEGRSPKLATEIECNYKGDQE